MTFDPIDMGLVWGYSVAMKQLNLRIPDETYELLKRQAMEDRRSLNAEIVWLLDQALSSEGDQR
jgi:hypothetical protein